MLALAFVAVLGEAVTIHGIEVDNGRAGEPEGPVPSRMVRVPFTQVESRSNRCGIAEVIQVHRVVVVEPRKELGRRAVLRPNDEPLVDQKLLIAVGVGAAACACGARARGA